MSILTLEPLGLYVMDGGVLPEPLPCVRPDAPTVPYEVRLMVDYRRAATDEPGVLHAFFYTAARVVHRTAYSASTPIACSHQSCYDWLLAEADRLGVPRTIPSSVLELIDISSPLWHNRTDIYSRPFDLAILRDLLERDAARHQEDATDA